MSRTKIEWTGPNGHVWNPTVGCTWAGPECDHCYAVTMSRRLAAMGQADYQGLTTDKHFNGAVKALEHKLDVPLKRRKPTTYFVNSMSDLFHKEVPFDFVDKVFAVMAVCKQHTFQVLTKRPERMAEYTQRLGYPGRLNDWLIKSSTRGSWWDAKDAPEWPLPNVWLGTSVGVEPAKHRIDSLRNVNAAVRFLSLEPLLEDLGVLNLDGIHWVIVGGESGHGARPCNIDDMSDIIEQCRAARVPVFAKQLGANPVLASGERYTGCDDKKGGNWDEWPNDLRFREYPTPTPSTP